MHTLRAKKHFFLSLSSIGRDFIENGILKWVYLLNDVYKVKRKMVA